MGLLANHAGPTDPHAERDRHADWDERDEQDHSGFFVHPDECLYCGQCQRLAPAHFTFSEESEESYTVGQNKTRNFYKHAFSMVIRQPENNEELDVVIDAVDNCMCDCIYYGGDDPKVEKALRDSKVDPVVFVRAPATEV